MNQELNKLLDSFEKIQKTWQATGHEGEKLEKLKQEKIESPEAFIDAMDLYITTAKHGNDPNFSAFLARIHDKAKNKEQAIYWLHIAAEKGHVVSQEQLGSAYFTGQIVDKDLDSSIYWFAKAGEQGSLNAQKNLVSIFYNGEQIPKLPELAFYWTKMAANQGSTPHQYILAHMYWTADGTDKSNKDSAYWANQARQNGHENAEKIWNMHELWKYLDE